jgi:hypothetical protein
MLLQPPDYENPAAAAELDRYDQCSGCEKESEAGGAEIQCDLEDNATSSIQSFLSAFSMLTVLHTDTQVVKPRSKGEI